MKEEGKHETNDSCNRILDQEKFPKPKILLIHYLYLLENSWHLKENKVKTGKPKENNKQEITKENIANEKHKRKKVSNREIEKRKENKGITRLLLRNCQ